MEGYRMARLRAREQALPLLLECFWEAAPGYEA
jgi:hypothetical protein